jgi:transcriptional regulator with XRE-family HTH domain
LQTKKDPSEALILEAIGARVRTFREAKGLSLSEFGEIVNRDKSNLAKLEKGKFEVTSNFLHYLLKKYPRFNLEWLILGEGDMENE